MPAKSKHRIRPVIEEVQPSSSSSPSSPLPPSQPVAPKRSAPEAQAKEVIKELDELNGSNKKKNSPAQKTNYKLIILVTALTALIVGFVSGGVYVYFSGLSSLGQPDLSLPQPTPTPLVSSPSPRPSLSPSPTPAEAPDLEKYKLSVLNGSGKIGAAGTASDALEKAGFSVTHTGNAANYSFKDTIIQTTSDVPETVIIALKKALSSYTTELGDSLPISSQYDIVVTVGAQ